MLFRIYIIANLIVLFGCAVPGSHLSVKDKVVIKTAVQQDISTLVKVHPVTPELLKILRKTDLGSRDNPQLDLEISNYAYRVGKGDILSITVWGHPELTIPAGQFRSPSDTGNWVHQDGAIFYPYIGRVQVNGRTLDEVRISVSNKLVDYIETPQVEVNVAAFRSKRVYVTGEVKNPGTQPITNIPLTLLDAVNKAGGLTGQADWEHVTINRNGRDEMVSLEAILQYGVLSENRLLIHNDIVHIPRNDNLKVFVMGEVVQPATLKMGRAGMRLTEALSNVGGLNELRADATGVFVIRGTSQNNEQVADIYQFNLQDAAMMILGMEFYLKPYDIVYVTAMPIIRWNRVISQLLPTVQGINAVKSLEVNRLDAVEWLLGQ